MTKVLVGNNVNGVFTDALWWLKVAGIREDSRNGPVLVAPGPVVSEYKRPWERLVFNPQRDANHVFHLMEALWMLAGNNDVSWLLPFNARFIEYTEDGVFQHGAYGNRWRSHFARDQIVDVIDELRVNPHSRRAVIAMWNPIVDSRAPVRDVPCNTHIYFDCRGGKLNMTVCNRSNDALWGCYGANVVHMSVLMELIAAAVGVEMGVYRQFSNNLHLYTNLPMAQDMVQNPPFHKFDLYGTGEAKHFKLLWPGEQYEDLLADCEQFCKLGDVDTTPPQLRTNFMRMVAQPLYNAYLDRRMGVEPDFDALPDCDWTLAFQQWVDRRNK